MGEGYGATSSRRRSTRRGAEDWITPARAHRRRRARSTCTAGRGSLASTSAREGWGMTITEAAACGTPAVVTRIAGHADAVVDGTHRPARRRRATSSPTRSTACSRDADAARAARRRRARARGAASRGRRRHAARSRCSRRPRSGAAPARDRRRLTERRRAAPRSDGAAGIAPGRLRVARLRRARARSRTSRCC